MDRLSIALAEDEPALQKLYSYWLTEMGYKVTRVDNGEDLLHVCRTTPIDMIVSDIRMPQLDGLTAVTILRHEIGLPAVLISGTWSETEENQAQEAGVANLAKPFRVSDLYAAMDHAATCGSMAGVPAHASA
jgi:CheY-like chemotaxis protein